MSKGENKKKNEKNYEVGYCKPPKEHQYKKGQSGNSNGKRPNPKTLNEVMVKILKEKVPVKIDGKIVKISRLESLGLSIYQGAMKQNSAFLKEVIKQWGNLSIEDKSKKDTNSSTTISLERISEIKRAAWAELDARRGIVRNVFETEDDNM